MEKMDEKIDKLISITEKFHMNVKANKDEIAEIKDKVKDMKTYLEVMQNPVG